MTKLRARQAIYELTELTVRSPTLTSSFLFYPLRGGTHVGSSLWPLGGRSGDGAEDEWALQEAGLVGGIEREGACKQLALRNWGLVGWLVGFNAGFIFI